MNIINNLKIYKFKKNLNKYKYCLDSGNIIDGNMRMLPYIRWIFMQSKESPNVFVLDLAICYKNNTIKESGYYYDCFSLDDDLHYEIDNKNKLTSFSSYQVLGNNKNVYVLDFAKNVKPEDIYDYKILKKVVKEVVDEINNAIYSNNDDEENINRVEKDMDLVSPLSLDEVKQLIKTGHRKCMDDFKAKRSNDDGVDDHRIID